jgi:hypothetical protein
VKAERPTSLPRSPEKEAEQVPSVSIVGSLNCEEEVNNTKESIKSPIVQKEKTSEKVKEGKKEK